MGLFLRNLFFTIAHPGLVAGLFPYYVLGGSARKQVLSQPIEGVQYAAIFLFALGFLIMTLCIIGFARVGRGTLSPFDPTRRLVITGLYKYSRNPMYVGVMGMLIAEAMFFHSNSLWMYTGGVFIAFNIFILIHEEPRLQNDFGEEYTEYRKNVRRWI